MNLDDFTYLVDDNFLDPSLVQKIHATLLDGEAEWVLGRQLLSKDYRFKTDIDPYEGSQFNHLFFIDSKVYSPEYWEMAYSILMNFCAKNNVLFKALMRCKANLTFPDTNLVGHSKTPHVDHPWQHLVLLYYINDADGDTILYNEKFDENNEVSLTELVRVSPKAGRAVLFSGSLYHSPSVPTEGYRGVINFTFLGDFK